MSKKENKKSASAEHSWIWVLVAAIAILITLVLVVSLLAGREDDPTPTKPSVTQPATKPVKIENPETVNINLGSGMELVDVAKYTGIYMEDGTDDIVSGLLMIVVKNTGEKDIQYAEIELPVNDTMAYFKLTTLPVGETMIVLEKNRMAYVDAEFTTAISKNVVLFEDRISLCEDKVKLQANNGSINVTNVSGGDITGDIVIYYKNYASDTLYGGVTYRCLITGGLRKGELKQVYAGHYSTASSRVVFVTCG